MCMQGYGPLIGALGPNIVEFLFNLNALHLHLSIGMPAMRPPTFAVEEVCGHAAATVPVVGLQLFRPKQSHINGMWAP